MALFQGKRDGVKQLNDLIQSIARRTILVVEDSRVNRMMVCAILEKDFDVLLAENGLIGLDVLENHYRDVDLILLDVYMPECDGFEFLRRKKEDERFATIPVIVATASGSIDDEIRCLELGANDFVVKPYDSKVMVNRINNMIQLRESAAIANQLMNDSVTGLFSKEYFYRAVEETLAARPDVEFDMVCSDVENFKSLNDRYGEGNCDALLRILADRESGIMPGLVAGGRIGVDVFAFLVEHQSSDWERILSKVTEGLPFANLNVKFGVVEHVDLSHAVPMTCNRAISALETIKGRHGVEIAFFDDDLHQRQLLEQAIRENMEMALSGFQFTVFYQPKHDARTGLVGGAEALVRWFHPEIGFISPSLFIPIFERNGFISKLDMFVWEEACKELRHCIDAGLPVVPISVNVSRIDFDAPDLAAQIARLADKHKIDHGLLHIELTETAYSDNPETVIETLSLLKSHGFSTELDDFGAGYSSLVSLNMLPLDVMKLDMSMIHQATVLGDYRIVESTIKLAQILGLKTVVEGVETAEEAQKVKEMGCDLIQGYYYSKPLKREEFEAYLLQFGR